jgi:hypothetical protein
MIYMSREYYDGLDWIYLSQNIEEGTALVNTVMNFLVP